MNEDNMESNYEFYEIEYDSCPMPGVGKFVLKSQKVEPPRKDEIRELFYSMRDIARQYPLPLSNYSRAFDRRGQQGNARVFYKQAVFMKDFEDDYSNQVPFSSYFPYYQMLGYEQLRTYFSWRTLVRKGIVGNTALSYVYLYLYELLNNVGVDSPQEGLDKLLFFWKSFKKHESSIDKFVIRWLKDYHIYYDLPHTFKDFVRQHNLTKHYPNIFDTKDNFDLFCAISKYDIRKSAFFIDDNVKLITDSFYYVIEKIRLDFEIAGTNLYDALFHPTKKIAPWTPFKDALFHNWLKQPDKRIVFSENEIYLCINNEWKFSTIITTDKGRQFIGYVMKQMEAVLRKATKFKYNITANIDMIDKDTLSMLHKSGLFIENIVQAATTEFYKEATKTVVTVNQDSLARIRQEAFVTQESLIVPLSDQNIFSKHYDTQSSDSKASDIEIDSELCDIEIDSELSETKLSDNESSDTKSIDLEQHDNEFISEAGLWESLKDALIENELIALDIILQDDNDINGTIKQFADDNNIMLEVLMDGINEKAMDIIGDNILDDLEIYEDYKDQVKGMVE